MTSTAGMTQHPDVSEISDLAEGLLPPSRSAELRRHLDDCALCADVHASLEEIRGLLGALPGAARMPADITERIDAALAAEALLDSTSPAADVHVSRETSPVAGREKPGAPSRPAGHTRGTTGPGRVRRTGRRRATVLGAVLTLAAVGAGGLLFLAQQSGSDPGASAAQDVSSQSKSALTKDFSGSDLEAQVKNLITGAQDTKSTRETRAAAGSSFEAEKAPQPMNGATTLPPCVQRATSRPDTPIAVEEGAYQGETAFLAVFPHSTDSHRVQAFVIAENCVSAAPSSTGEVLRTETFLRH
ncbi:anti-sigma factor family protein [Streptomyces jumonjinensis]|uniref:anti-sigma factor family protein n=1 Tax=Streptomyces jumonjinensis TaxID=1945 RepID=UPI0037BD4FED